MNCIFLEAEAFDALGGWTTEQQSIGQMGSAYVMAHGMGIPVADAETAFSVAAAGSYTLWARTRDWTAVWKRGTPAGRFLLKADGDALPETLGTNGERWSWQRAGTVLLAAGVHRLALHDLTGFNGRCDAVVLCDDSAFVPPNGVDELAAFREQWTGHTIQDDAERYDLIVCGGGMAGCCLALSAIRTGSRVLLLQDRDVLGGCNSSEIRISQGGMIHLPPYPNLGNVVSEIAPVMGTNHAMEKEYYEDFRKAAAFENNSSDYTSLLLGYHVTAVELDPADKRRICAVIAVNVHTGERFRFRASLFADCTGDALIARLSGAEVLYGREDSARFGESLAPKEADRQVMGHSVLWYTRPQNHPVTFPDIDWGIEFTDETCYKIRGGDWEQETGQYRNMAEETEYIRDYGMMAIYANWSFLKNHSRDKAAFARDALCWVSPIGGKRESYRVVGDHLLTQSDVEDHIAYPDASACMTWSIDLHFPEPDNTDRFGEAFRSCAYHRGYTTPYAIPYRCLYARDVKNLFLGGRDISASHIAFSAIRVMRTLGALGEVAGLAASVCVRHGCLPRDVYTTYLDELIEAMKAGVPVPAAFACGIGSEEAYHFKDIGWLHLNRSLPWAGSGPQDPAVQEKFRRNIARLGMNHKYPLPEFLKKKTN